MISEKNRKSIKNWAEEDRPREKMISKGKFSLTNAELLAILIGSGNADESAVELSKRILADVDNKLSGLSKLSVNDLVKRYKGIGIAKAVTISSAIELGNRRLSEPQENQQAITDSRFAFQALAGEMCSLSYESFWVLFLNRAKKIIRKECISVGGFTETSVDIRKIFKLALEWNAVEMIIAHNHPSGNLKPSNADNALTAQIKNAGSLLNIPVIDHLILSTEQEYFSYTDKGLI